MDNNTGMQSTFVLYDGQNYVDWVIPGTRYRITAQYMGPATPPNYYPPPMPITTESVDRMAYALQGMNDSLTRMSGALGEVVLTLRDELAFYRAKIEILENINTKEIHGPSAD